MDTDTARAAAARQVFTAEQRASLRTDTGVDDRRVVSRRSTFHARGRQIGCHLFRPSGAGRYPGIVVIAEHGIDERCPTDACIALAQAGFAGLAPDLSPPVPSYPYPNASSGDLAAPLRESDDLEIIQAGAGCLEASTFVESGRLGVVGFRRGGRLALLFAARHPQVQAVVAFHPAAIVAEDVVNLKAAVQIHHGTADKSVAYSRSVDAETYLRRQRTPVELLPYQGCAHGFAALAEPGYDQKAASLAWNRSIGFLTRKLAS